MVDSPIVATWKSLHYPSIMGRFTYSKLDHTKLTCTFEYDPESRFYPGTSKTFIMNFIDDGNRLIASTDLAFEQNMTITVIPSKNIGYYSCVFPVDSGKITLSK